MENNFEIGFTACYIRDFNFDYLCGIPVEAAVEWVKKQLPEIAMSSHVKAKDLTTDGNNDTGAECNGWLNKLFVIVGEDKGKWIALYNHDGEFSIRTKDQ
jgi:hypothetical protein